MGARVALDPELLHPDPDYGVLMRRNDRAVHADGLKKPGQADTVAAATPDAFAVIFTDQHAVVGEDSVQSQNRPA